MTRLRLSKEESSEAESFSEGVHGNVRWKSNVPLTRAEVQQLETDFPASRKRVFGGVILEIRIKAERYEVAEGLKDVSSYDQAKIDKTIVFCETNKIPYVLLVEIDEDVI